MIRFSSLEIFAWRIITIIISFAGCSCWIQSTVSFTPLPSISPLSSSASFFSPLQHQWTGLDRNLSCDPSFYVPNSSSRWTTTGSATTTSSQVQRRSSTGSRLHAESPNHRRRDGTKTLRDVSYSNYLATCVPGLAHVLKREMVDLDHSDLFEVETSGNAAVTFRASREASLYALCWLRSAHRLLELVASTDSNDDDEDHYGTNMILRDRQDVHNFIRQKVNVKNLLGDGQGGLLTVSVKVVMNNPRYLPQDLTHSHYTALTIKNALCDVVREMRGDRPDVDVDNADVPLVAIFLGSKAPLGDDGAATLCLYRSLHPPGSLHRRGYRQGSAIHKAAMKESLAAGLLIEAGWLDKLRTLKMDDNDNECGHGSHNNNIIPRRLRFMDPMAGSGSLVVEAAMMAADIAPGLMRVRCGLPNSSMPPVTRWKQSSVAGKEEDDDEEEEEDAVTMWKRILLEATQRAKNGIQFLRQNTPLRIQIGGNDIHPGAIDIMESALSNAGLSDFVDITNMDCYDLSMMEGQYDDGEDNDDGSPRTITTTTTACLVATNPPWGVRLTDDIAQSWEGLRHFVRDQCPAGTEVYVLSGDKTATGTLKLKRDRMIPLQTGDQHLRWIQYTIGGGGGNKRTTGSNSQMSSNDDGGGGPASLPFDEIPVQSKNVVNSDKKKHSTNAGKKQYATNVSKKKDATNAGKTQYSTARRKVRPVTATTARSERNEWL